MEKICNNLPIQGELRKMANPEKAKILSRFFKTGKGQYGEGDIFLGITVPDTRKLVKKYLKEMNLEKVATLLSSEYHEERLAGVHTLVEFSKKGPYSIRELGGFYMNHRDRINNWDLVDTSAPHIIGPYLELFPSLSERETFIESCITSENLWINRIIVLASFYHINKLHDETVTFQIVPKFLSHPHDLIHKACGWMLREVGKRVSETRLCEFLDEYASKMPRTMLRYAIERLDSSTRAMYLKR